MHAEKSNSTKVKVQYRLKYKLLATLIESKNLKTNNRPIIIPQFPKEQLTIGSYVSVCPSRCEARRKFGEHKRCLRVAQGVAMSNSSFWSALQTSQVLHISMNAQLTYEPIVLEHFQPHGKFFSQGICLLMS